MMTTRPVPRAAIVLGLALAIALFGAFALVGASTASAHADRALTHVSTRHHKRATGSAQKPAVESTGVKISNFKFVPATITIKAGTNVVWTNKDAIGHSVNFDTVKVNSKTLNQDARFSHTFTTPGTYAYICAIHPFMHATVIVTA
jgi:plastocyanin